MDEFFSAYANAKLKPGILQSCYAMAETVFAVTQSDVTGLGPRRIWVDGDTFQKQGRALPTSKDAVGAVCRVSSGSCLPGTQIRIVSDGGEDLTPGNVGEIVIRSESMLDGYYNRPDLTTKAIRNGWYWSGDLGFLVDDELYVTGRRKDLIIVGGKNIYPQDVEEIVSLHRAIYDGRVVAFGRYNASLGTEEIVVVAEVHDESDLQNAETIERELRSSIAAELDVGIGSVYLKPPRWIVKSTAGKPARSTTREKLFAECADLQVPGELT